MAKNTISHHLNLCSMLTCIRVLKVFILCFWRPIFLRLRVCLPFSGSECAPWSSRSSLKQRNRSRKMPHKALRLRKGGSTIFIRHTFFIHPITTRRSASCAGAFHTKHPLKQKKITQLTPLVNRIVNSESRSHKRLTPWNILHMI